MSDTTAALLTADIDPTTQTVDNGFMRAVKDCASGTVGGIVQVLVGQPFDTVKVRLQSQPLPAPGQSPMYSGLLDCVRKTRKQEGFRAFYKGTATPLVGIGACVSIQFVVLEHMKRLFTQENRSKHGIAIAGTLSNQQLYIAGATAGIANSLVSGPVEHIRTRLQVQVREVGGKGNCPPVASRSALLPFFDGPLACFNYVYREYGLRGIYKGQAVTMLREFQGYGCYFLVYEYLMQRAMQHSQKARNELPGWVPCLFGATAGYVMWISVYPIDVLKSKIQTDFFSARHRKYAGILDCAKKTFASEGVPGFFRGFAACMLRAGPVNAATFVAFEAAMRAFERWN